MRMQQQRVFFLAPLLLVVLPVLIGPTAFGFFASFTNYGPTEIHPRFVGVANYVSVLRDKQFATATSNILWFTLVTVSAELLFCVGRWHDGQCTDRLARSTASPGSDPNSVVQQCAAGLSAASRLAVAGLVWDHAE